MKPDQQQPGDNPEVVDLFLTPWARAFIRSKNAHELEGVEIFLTIGQELMRRVPGQRKDHQTLDIVLGSLLRPGLLSAKGAYESLRSGIYEPALAQTRTLLELDIVVAYLLSEAAAKDHRADRFIAWSYRKRSNPLAEQLGAPSIRNRMDAKHIEWIQGRLKVYSNNISAVPAAAAENKVDGGWHPHGGLKGLARHLNRLDDYLQIYAPFSGMSVHAADPESHLNTPHGGPISFKALSTTDPHKIATALKLPTGYIQKFLSRFRDEWELQGTSVDHLLLAATMRWIGTGDGSIPVELHPEEWQTAIRLTQAPFAEILEEASQLVIVVVRGSTDGLTEREITTVVGIGDNDTLPAAHLRLMLGNLVTARALRVDEGAVPLRYHAA